MIASNHRLAVNGTSMIGSCIRERKARISLDVGDEEKHFKNPFLPETRSEMGLPLITKGEILGALTVQSEKVNAFGDTDVAALQSMADQLAIALRNAKLLQELEGANSELLRTKTFEAIATATGEAIHWVGNKAAPIPGSADRVREDLINFMTIFKTLLDLPNEERDAHPYADVAREAFDLLPSLDINLKEKVESLNKIPAKQLPLVIDIESSLEDIGIIKQSAQTILNIKEDLIGPGRLPKPGTINIPLLFGSTANGMGYPAGVVTLDFPDDLPEAWGDKAQVGRVLINLIKNAWEASDKGNQTKIRVSARIADEPEFVRVEVSDNGPGIPPEIMEKIWVSFFTTKGDRGGTGLGLSACMEIISQSGGKIWVESEVGEGATFIILLPMAMQ